jgi:hypothetical protein
MKMKFNRMELIYETVMIDLYLMGAIDKSVIERFIGHGIPDFLVAPPELPKEEYGSKEGTE